jgi:hypothetical protein
VRAGKTRAFEDVREAFEAARAAIGEDGRVIVLPQAGSIMPKIGLKNDLDALLSGVYRCNHRKG